MTVVCWDGTTLAADKRMSYGGHFNTVTKLVRVGRYIAGFSGSPQLIGAFVAWVNGGEDPAKFPTSPDEDRKLYALCVRDDGVVLKFENAPYALPIEDRCCATGSGRDFARAAMHLGCTAAEAVAVTALFDENCGNGVDTLTLIDRRRTPDRRTRMAKKPAFGGKKAPPFGKKKGATRGAPRATGKKGGGKKK